ncbi:glycosyltransferase family 39 protein [Pedobacter aquatilis]|uniref:ArnT family glycosyltransferase n=1 Tax=Pedobacter aquatilis TaxID=351343 RepID=UPI0029302AF6|nr:glycosyltransferase family 39 protein [Pedobacter aquatilis]
MLKAFPKKLWLFVLAMAIVKVIIAASIGLGNDEVYYWTYALKPEWNYFDHPPFIAWLIRATTLNLSIHQELAVRFGAICSSSLCTFIIFKIGQIIGNNRVAWYAALLYTASFYCSIIAGTFILPDGPQMVFWLWAIYLFIKLNKSVSKGSKPLKIWLCFGVAVGLCMLCKIHGLFLWFAVLSFALVNRPKILLDKGLYIAIGITIILFSPVLIWNFQHHFISYTYHSERVNLIHPSLNLLSLSREVAGSLFYNNPVVFILIWLSVLSPFRSKTYIQRQERQILLYFGLPLVLTLLLVSLFRDTLPHWSGPGYACLILLAALKLEEWTMKNARLWLKIALFLFFAIITAGMLIINFYPGSLSAEKRTLFHGKNDPTLDMYGWKETGRIVDSVYRHNKWADEKISTIVVNKWFPAAHLDFNVAQQADLHTYGIGEIFDLHQYTFTNAGKHRPEKGESCIYIVPSNLFDDEDFKKISAHFVNYNQPLIIPILRRKEVCKNILIFKLNGFKN